MVAVKKVSQDENSTNQKSKNHTGWQKLGWKISREIECKVKCMRDRKSPGVVRGYIWGTVHKGDMVNTYRQTAFDQLS